MSTLIKQGPVGELINRLYDLYLDGQIKQLACIVLDTDDMICDPAEYSTMSYPELIGSMQLAQEIIDTTKGLEFQAIDPTDLDTQGNGL